MMKKKLSSEQEDDENDPDKIEERIQGILEYQSDVSEEDFEVPPPWLPSEEEKDSEQSEHEEEENEEESSEQSEHEEEENEEELKRLMLEFKRELEKKFG